MGEKSGFGIYSLKKSELQTVMNLRNYGQADANRLSQMLVFNREIERLLPGALGSDVESGIKRS